MPSNIVQSFAKKTGKSQAEVEKLWDKAKEIAKDAGEEENYSYITGILKKILKINETFRDFLDESREYSQDGFTVGGHLMKVDLNKKKYNNLIEITVSGSRILAKLKSLERLKSEYNEEDWPKLEKIWTKIADKYSAKTENVLQDFELKLNKIVIEMEKELEKF